MLLSCRAASRLSKVAYGTIQKNHLQCKENDEAKCIKASFTLPHLNEAAQCVATIIVNEPPAQMPALCGLVQETTVKSTLAMEWHLQSLKDQLKAIQGGKKHKKKSRAMGQRRPPWGS
jgi:hypothetical protein